MALSFLYCHVRYFLYSPQDHKMLLQILRNDFFAATARYENVVNVEARCHFRHILYFTEEAQGCE